MNLGDTGNEAKCIVPPEKHVGNKVDIFLRDFSCWYEAFIKNWWIIAGCAIFMAVLFVVYRSWKVPQIYSSSCLLVRQSVADMKHSDFPQNYNNTQMNVIINIAQEKSALQEMARRLDINADSDKLHKMIVVQPSTENSDYGEIKPNGSKRLNSINNIILTMSVLRGNAEDYIGDEEFTTDDIMHLRERRIQFVLL